MAVIRQLILASGSPYRKDLLAATGLQFIVQSPDVDEQAITSFDPGDLARKRAEAKAQAVALEAGDALVLGADQVLSLDGRSFDKVDNREDAAERLRHLSGKCHFLHSAFTLVGSGDVGAHPVIHVSYVVDIPMQMRELTRKEIDIYAATDEWRGSVGCYKVEKRGIMLFSSVPADFSSIVGLPLVELLEALRQLGINVLENPLPPWVI